jgi:hypothetical protein
MKNKIIATLIAIAAIAYSESSLAWNEGVAMVDDTANLGAELGFNSETVVDDSELAEVRGKYISAGGLIIDFAIQTRTIIDGNLVNDVTLTTSEALDYANSEISKIVQVGQNGQGVARLAETQGTVVQVIQNNLNDVTVQNLNTLDLDVHNTSEYARQLGAASVIDGIVAGL